MAVLNWYVAFHFPTDTWVNFKVWGGIGLFLVFALAQGLMLARHIEEPQHEPQSRSGRRRAHARGSGWRRWRQSCSNWPTTAPSTPATPAPRRAAGTFRC